MTTETRLNEKESWHLGMMAAQAKSFTSGKILSDLADEDERIVVLTADLGYSNRTIEFVERHPDRFFNLGIAEHNMVTAAAGLATIGFVPYVATFASFLGLLCCEQIRTDLAYPNLPVRMIAHHAGISLGYYGTSHHATEDIGIMRSIANVKIVCPVDTVSLEQALRQTVSVEGPVYFRVGRGRDPDVYHSGDEWKFGKISRLKEGKDALIIANGHMVSEACEAAKVLQSTGIDIAVVDLHTIEPLDKPGLREILSRVETVFVAEEHNTRSGVASAVADTIVDERLSDVRLVRIGFPSDEYSIIGAPYYLYNHYGLDSDGIVKVVTRELKK